MGNYNLVTEGANEKLIEMPSMAQSEYFTANWEIENKYDGRSDNLRCYQS